MPLATYVCSLSEESIKKAKEELNEDPKERLGAVQSLREWTDTQPWINTPTDPRFLLSFLRCSKFSQLGARERLTNFFTAYSDTGNYSFMLGNDPGDRENLEIVKKGMFMVLPGRDKFGRLVILGRFGNFNNLYHLKYEQLFRAIIPLFHSVLFLSEETQVNGLVYVYDIGGIAMKTVTFYGADRLRHSAQFSHKAYPGRIKSINYCNSGPMFEAVMTIIKPFLSEKLRQRTTVHHSLTTLYELVDLSMLPEEYLPDDYKGPTAGSTESIVERTIQEYYLEPEKREFLKDLYSGKYGVNTNKKPTGGETMASFRKLNIS